MQHPADEAGPAPICAPEFPRIVLVDLSTACNAACVTCPTQLNPLRKKLISETLFESLVEQVSAFPVNEMFLIGVHGEPLLQRYHHNVRGGFNNISLAIIYPWRVGKKEGIHS
jgi:hypothetical protein